MLAAPNSPASVGTLITQFIVAVGGFAGIAAAINAVFSRRKTNAEAGTYDANAAKVISDTAAAQVARMDARILTWETRIAAQDDRIVALEEAARASRRREAAAAERERDDKEKLREFADWCALAARTLSEHGIAIEAPPVYTEPRPGRGRPPPR